MQLRRLRIMLIAQISSTLLVLIFAFQNCTNNVTYESTTPRTQNSGGNGEGYTGKPDKYQHFDVNNACPQLDRVANPLPNDEIFFQTPSSSATRAPHLVRENCRDIEPVQIAPTELEIVEGKDQFIYKGKSFSALTPRDDFAVVANPCPAGQSPIVGVTRNNLFVSGQNWTAQNSGQSWWSHDGIGVSLHGSINSLPSYRVLRNDPTHLEEYRRISQFLVLQNSTNYAFSFLVRAGTSGGATFRFFRYGSPLAPDESIIADFNLQSGTANVRENTTPTAAQVAITPVGNGYLCTVYFTTTSVVDQSNTDIGISPTGVSSVGLVGDSIFASVAQLERVGDYCQ